MADDPSAAVPMAGAAVAILFWGTFAVPMKTKSVEDAKLNPFVFQLYMSVGIFLSSWLVLLVEPFAWTPYGAVASFIWATGSLFAVPTIRDLGVSVGQGVWSGFVAVTAFLWGVFGHSLFSIFGDDPMRDPLMASIGLAVLVLGMLGLACVGSIAATAQSRPGNRYAINSESQPFLDRPSSLGRRSLPRIVAAPPASKPNMMRGFLTALIVGVTGGSTLVPMKFAPEIPFRDGTRSVIFALSFGMSVLPISICLNVLPVLWQWGELPKFHVRTCALPGILSGVLWNLANIGSIYAVQEPLGLTVGYPLTQCCLVVAGLFGICYYKEVSGALHVGMWLASALTLLGGAAMLGVYGSAADADKATSSASGSWSQHTF